MGFRLVNFQTPSLFDPRTLDLCDATMIVNLEDDLETLTNIARIYHERQSLAGAYSQNEYGLLAAATINEKLGLQVNFNSFLTTLTGRNKRLFRQAMAGSPQPGPVPNWCFCETRDEVLQFMRRNDSLDGWLLKPTCGVGSIGVHHVFDTTEIGECVIPTDGILIEEFVEGEQYSAETFSRDGEHVLLCINREINSTHSTVNRFVNVGHYLPAAIPQDLRREIADVVLRALDTLGVKHGPAHTEVLVRNSQVFIIEVNTRMAGEPIPELMRLALGIDLTEMAIAWFLRRPTCATGVISQGGAAVRHFTPGPGQIKDIAGVPGAWRIPGVRDVSLKKVVGEFISPLQSSFDRVGYVIATGHTAAEAYARCEEAVSCVTFVTALDDKITV